MKKKKLRKLVQKTQALVAEVQAKAASLPTWSATPLTPPITPSGASAEGRIRVLADAALRAGRFPTLAQAIAGILKENPDLYTAHLAEMEGQRTWGIH